MQISGSVAVVLGAAHPGIGKAYVQALLDKGAKVVFGDINETVGAQTCQEFVDKYGRDRVAFRKCDVTKEEDVTGIFDVASSTFGAVDIAVNNVAIIHEFNWQACLDINVGGMIKFTNVALARMGKDKGGKGGVLVGTSSVSGLYPDYWAPVYSASKHAMTAFIRSWADPLNFSQHGIRMNCICPATVDTSFVNSVVPERAHHAAQKQEDISKEIKLNPSVLGEVLVQILEDDSVNGSAIAVFPDKTFTVKDFPVNPNI